MSARSAARALFVAPALPPVAAPESIATVKRLNALAGLLDLTVLAADDRRLEMFPRADHELAALLPAGVSVRRVPWPRRRPWMAAELAAHLAFTSSGVARPIDLLWARRALRVIRSTMNPRDFDGIITNSMPIVSHLIGHALTRIWPSLRWVQHYSDPLVDLTYRRYQPISRWIDTRWERRFLGRADLVTVTSPETRDLLLARYAARIADLPARIVVIPHTFDPAMFREAETRRPAMAGRVGGGGLPIAHVGHFYGRRSISPVLAWLDWRREHAKDGPPVTIHLFGSLRGAERALVASSYADVVHLHDSLPYLDSLAVMRASRALLVVDAPADGPSVHFPSKLADYLGAGRPIIAFTPDAGATSRILSETGHLAVSVSPEPPDFARIEARLRDLDAAVQPALQYANTPDVMAPVAAAIRLGDRASATRARP